MEKARGVLCLQPSIFCCRPQKHAGNAGKHLVQSLEKGNNEQSWTLLEQYPRSGPNRAGKQKKLLVGRLSEKYPSVVAITTLLDVTSS